MPRLLPLSLVLLALVALAPARDAQDRLKLEKKRDDLLRELGDRHLDLGLWCRDKGLTTQAAAELVLAVEISERKHHGGQVVLGVMRRYDEEFWKKNKRGSEASRKSYEVKAERARERDAKDKLEFADWAWGKGYEKDALDVYLELVRDAGDELVFDAKGRLKIDVGAVREEVAAYVKSKAVEIDGKLYLGGGLLDALPALEGVREVTGETLRVRGPIDEERLERHRAMGAALLAKLEEDLQVRPTRRLDVFVFPTRDAYDAWLQAEGLGAWSATGAFADGATSTAVVCAQDKTDAEVDALLLHELTHLFWFASTPTGMPDWFGEGLAETYGGQGTFAWDGAELAVGGAMDEHRLVQLKTGTLPFSLDEMLSTRAIDLWSTDSARALQFYAQAWAFVRYLRTAAPEDQRERFDLWLAMCAGSAAGGDSWRARDRNAAPSAELFRKDFGVDLTSIERDFRGWVQTL